jgi:hypothetical protein
MVGSYTQTASIPLQTRSQVLARPLPWALPQFGYPTSPPHPFLSQRCCSRPRYLHCFQCATSHAMLQLNPDPSYSCCYPHSFLCTLQCATWHALLQYPTRRSHLAQRISTLPSLLLAVPHLAHAGSATVSAVFSSAIVSSAQLSSAIASCSVKVGGIGLA